MSYTDLFSRYGSISESGETRVYIHALNPAKLDTAERIADYDKSAARYIAELETIIENLKEYRQALAKRYGELETMPYGETLIIERIPRWHEYIEYSVRIERIYGDGTKRTELNESYKGNERSKAKKRFGELKKSRPGIRTRVEIEKRSWEK